MSVSTTFWVSLKVSNKRLKIYSSQGSFWGGNIPQVSQRNHWHLPQLVVWTISQMCNKVETTPSIPATCRLCAPQLIGQTPQLYCFWVFQENNQFHSWAWPEVQFLLNNNNSISLYGFNLLTLRAHAQEGDGTCLVCVFVCLCVCLLPLFQQTEQ